MNRATEGLNDAAQPVDISFPEYFLWGSATSAHQVEGANSNNDWWDWEQAGNGKDKSERACEHYDRYAQDFDLAASLHHNAHRFSIEWSRVEPDEGVWDDAALAHYAAVVDALRARNIEPIVTLHHFTTPRWLIKKCGWTENRVVDYFARYARRVAEALRGKVRYWITINEPMVFVNMHYVDGVGPPGLRDFPVALKVIENVIRAHAAAYQVIHEVLGSTDSGIRVFVAKALPRFYPARRWFAPDHFVSWMTDVVFNTAMLNAICYGRWTVPGLFSRSIPEARGSMDILGVNFYTRFFIRWVMNQGAWPGQYCSADNGAEVTDMGWEVHPPSFYNALVFAKRYGVPIFVSENGIASTDAHRWSFIVRHLRAMHLAIQQGVPILGYLHWSLLDNFEWHEGYSKRFGLIEVDYRTQERRVRESGVKLGEVYRANRLIVQPSPAA